jgi:hypothetical protein
VVSRPRIIVRPIIDPVRPVLSRGQSQNQSDVRCCPRQPCWCRSRPTPRTTAQAVRACAAGTCVARPVGSKVFWYSIGAVSSDRRSLPLNAGLYVCCGRTELYISRGAESRLLSLPTEFPLFCRLVQLVICCAVTLDGITVPMGGLGTIFGLLRPQQHRLRHLRRLRCRLRSIRRSRPVGFACTTPDSISHLLRGRRKEKRNARAQFPRATQPDNYRSGPMSHRSHMNSRRHAGDSARCTAGGFFDPGRTSNGS